MRVQKNVIYDDDGVPLADGSLVMVNGSYIRVVHFEGTEMCIHEWPEDELIFTLERIRPDPQRDEWPDLIEE